MDKMCSFYVSGNHYGTPKPSKESSTSSRSSEGLTFPGAHPSSEGKRRRNRSNVEAMTSKHFQDDKDEMEHTNGNQFILNSFDKLILLTAIGQEVVFARVVLADALSEIEDGFSINSFSLTIFISILSNLRSLDLSARTKIMKPLS